MSKQSNIPVDETKQNHNIESLGLIDAWFTTNRSCQNRCSFCYAQDTKFDKDLNMQPVLASKLIEICKAVGIKNILLLGGEPTLYPDIINLVSSIKKHAMNPVLITNGRRFSDIEFTKTIIKAGLTSINISAKATSRSKYLEITQSDGFDEMFQGYLNLRKFKVFPNIVLTLSKETLPNLKEMISEVVKWEPKRLLIEFGCPIIIDGKPVEKGIPDPHLIASCVDEACTILNETGLDFSFNYQIPLCLMKDITKKFLRDNDKLFYGCQLRSGTGVIFSTNGDIIPCSEFTKQVLFKYGTDYSNAEEFTKVWKSSTRRKLAEAFRYYPSETCVECNDWSTCGGGCPIRWLTYEPNTFIKAS